MTAARRLVVVILPDNVRAHSPAGVLPAYVSVSQDVLYEVIGVMDDERVITMLRDEVVRVVAQEAV